MAEINRRDTLSLLLSSLLATTLSARASANDKDASTSEHLTFGPPQAFSFDALKQRAEVMAGEPWKDGKSPYGEILQKIDYDAFQKIVFNKNDALWNDGKGGSPVQLFHLGRYFQEPVHIHVVEGGTAREILYRQSYFSMPPDHPAHALPDDIGFSGFRLHEQSQDYDWLAFLGASYFRSSGSLNQYGLSARGLAVDTALQKPEEFPRFSEIWLERKEGINDRVLVYALLDSPSITGAYSFDCSKTKGVIMDVDCSLYPRKPIERLGIAPLTSMYWYSETVKQQAIDWRPEIHDSDGLAIWMGNGERLWRPLNNPLWTVTNAFLDENPKGFGLLQRDRDFNHYQDDGVFYDRRPSVWIEPRGNWGKGQVQLVEIPTDVEIHDNIVMYWVPDGAVEPGRTLDFSYRMFWDADEPFPADLGRVVATYTGIGGIPGQDRPEGAVRFVVDFRGEKVRNARRGQARPRITLSRGEVAISDAYHVVDQPGLFRVFFDTIVEGSEPIDMRMYVEGNDGTALTETWLYQYFPQPFS
ncbi:glucans biosynthesis protein [Mesorhizobium sp. J18]|uniref:glucan biosynthesis protein n=1 Tax=Mesorhizobium sp. J18 TaxID=935263 RepID=UPI00119C8C96|nr:glucan biosynthesis protein D [Mesorhizobium sp. J18]TWG91269.1 glucans biosynthesis protein [Mesorhizobium sp. J18]